MHKGDWEAEGREEARGLCTLSPGLTGPPDSAYNHAVVVLAVTLGWPAHCYFQRLVFEAKEFSFLLH